MTTFLLDTSSAVFAAALLALLGGSLRLLLSVRTLTAEVSQLQRDRDLTTGRLYSLEQLHMAGTGHNGLLAHNGNDGKDHP